MICEIVAVKREESIFNHLVVYEIKDGKQNEDGKYGIRLTDPELKNIMKKMGLKYKKDLIGKKVLMREAGRIYIMQSSKNPKHGESYELHRIS